jgi:uncharacterized protein (DUF433 family)
MSWWRKGNSDRVFGNAVVLGTEMDPNFEPPSGSTNPAAWDAEIWIDRGRKSGQPCVYGSRVPVETLVRYADACGDDAALEAYPSATVEALAAARWFLAHWARMPEGGEAREEFGTQFANSSGQGWAFVEVYDDQDEADRMTDYMASLGDRPARTMRRVAIYGPWEEVTDA